jgi:hypothetical protein
VQQDDSSKATASNMEMKIMLGISLAGIPAESEVCGENDKLDR